MNKKLLLIIGLGICFLGFSQKTLDYYQPPQIIQDNVSIRMLPGFHANSNDGNYNNDSFIARIGDPNGSTQPQATYTPSLSENYIYERVYLYPVVTSNNYVPQTQSIQYLDGFEREIQKIQIKASSEGKDIVQHIDYDNYGRKSKEYLPYPSNSNGGKLISPSTAKQETLNYYKSAYPNDFPSITNPYKEMVYEENPNPLLVETSSPGEEWSYNTSNVTVSSGIRISSNHTNRVNYFTNKSTDNVKKFEVVFTNGDRLVPSLVNSGTYNDNALSKTVTYSENWNPGQSNPKDNTLEEYKNKTGKIVLTRSYINNLPQDTYNIYDAFGNLTYIIPPMASQNSTISTDILNGLCFQYKYDKRNRQVEKRLPDQDNWSSMVYDKQNRLVGSQDPNLKNQNKWQFSKFDVFGRIVYSGVTSNSTARPALQSTIDLLNSNNESLTNGGSIFGYSNNAFPSGVTVNDVYKVEYYDIYPSGAPFPSGNNVESQTVFTNPKGLVTLTKKRTIAETAENSWTDNYVFYDKYGRPIRNHNINHLGGYNIVDSKLNFTGKAIYTLTSNKRDANGVLISIKDIFAYDPQERIISHTQSVNNQAEIRIKDNILGKVGNIVGKKVGGLSMNTELQKVDFTYNVRGWLTAINDVNNLGSDLFAHQVNYNKPNNSYIGNVQYNGNISQTWSKTLGDNNLRGYSYIYDPLNRLKDAFSYKNGLINTASERDISYDAAGNIRSLYRSGGDDFTAVDMDLLSYTYYDNSNRLKSVTDNINNQAGFKDVAGTIDYEYDYNGNVTKDNNKGILSIQYNYMNLPTVISYMTNKWIKYKYSSDGVKLTKTVYDGKRTFITDYLNGFQYKGDELQFFSTEEGYVFNDGSSYKHVFNYTDHIGNIRVSYQDVNGDGVVNSTEILEQSSYYPFGLKQLGFGTQVYYPADQYKFKFSGKELQSELGLNVYDFGARNYFPDVSRWFGVDEKTEKYANISPYIYSVNNPVLLRDVDGKDWVQTNDGSWHWNGNITSRSQAINLGYSNYAQPGYTYQAFQSVSVLGDVRLGKNGEWHFLTPLQKSLDILFNYRYVEDPYLHNPLARPTIRQIPEYQGKTDIQMLVAENPLVQSAVLGAATGGVTNWALRTVRGVSTVTSTSTLTSASTTSKTGYSLVNLTEETFSQSVFTGAKNVSGYSIYGTEGLVGNTYNYNIFSINATEVKSLSGLKTLIQNLESQAINAGANRVSIYGSTVVNKGFLNPTIIQRFGYTFEQYGSGVIFQKALY